MNFPKVVKIRSYCKSSDYENKLLGWIVQQFRLYKALSMSTCLFPLTYCALVVRLTSLFLMYRPESE